MWGSCRGGDDLGRHEPSPTLGKCTGYLNYTIATLIYSTTLHLLSMLSPQDTLNEVPRTTTCY